MTIIEDRLSILDTILLGHGAHSDLDEGACAMEVVSYLADEPWSDHPACASKVISAFMRSWNDSLDDEGRQKLKPYLPKLIGTKGTKAQESKRAWMAADWFIRVQTPVWLELAGCVDVANQIRALPPVMSIAKAKSAMPTLDEARRQGAAAWDAARAAAWDAAGDAARDAAWTAAGDAARAAAWTAAGDAAWTAAMAAARAAAWTAAWTAARAAARTAARTAARAAARAAAWDAARDALEPTVTSLQASAFDLIDRLIAVSA